MGKLAGSNSQLARKSKTLDARFAFSVLSGQRRDRDRSASKPRPARMSNINPNCDGSHCRHGYKEVRKYPSNGGDALYLCLPCFANENMHRYTRAKQTGGTEDCPQISWSTAEVIVDKHGEPFDAEAAVPRGIVNYHQNGDSNGDE
jgi:hypothetical protein